MTMCVSAAGLCVVASVLTGTHVLRPLLSVSGCVYRRPDKACRCVTQFRRVGLGLEEAPRGDVVFLTMEGTLGCDDVHTVLPGLMYAMVGVYSVIALVCLVAGVIAFLVYRMELRRKYLQNLAYDDHLRSPSGLPLSDNHAEHHAMLPLQPSSPTNAPMLVNTYINPVNTYINPVNTYINPVNTYINPVNTYINPGSTANDEDDSTNNAGNTANDEDLIYSPADVPMGYAEACSMRRCQSFNQPRRGSLREASPGSSASSKAASLSGEDRNVGRASEGPSKLKAHRRKGRRAVTLHGLDREQLLLILSLQIRYLQESNQSTNREDNTDNNLGNTKHGKLVTCEPGVIPSLLYAQRRALTPTPRQERLSSNRSADDHLDYRPAKLVRSHTPQPHHFRATNEYNPHQHKLNQHSQQPAPDDDDDQPTLITFDLRNIKAGPVVYDHTSAQSSLSGCGPDNSYSSHNSLTCSSSAPSQHKLKPGPSHPLTHLSAESTCQGIVKIANVEDGGHHSNQLGHPSNLLGHPSNLLGYHTSQVFAPSQSDLDISPSDSDISPSDSDISPSDTRKLISSEDNLISEEEPTKNKSRKFSHVKKESDQPVEVMLHRTDSKGSRICAGTDRWQALMEDGPQQAQTLWENVQRKAPSDPHALSDPHASDYTLDSLLLPRHQLEAVAPDTGCCEPPYAIKAQIKHGDCAAVRSSQSDLSPQVTLTGQLGNLNVIFNNLPDTRCVPPHLLVSSNPNLNLHHRTLTTAPKSEFYPPLQNAFIPIDSSFTDNSEDTNCSPQQSDFGPTNQAALTKATVSSRCEVQQEAKLDHSSSGAQPSLDRLQPRPPSLDRLQPRPPSLDRLQPRPPSLDRLQARPPSLDRLQPRPKNSFDMEVASATHLNDPSGSSPSQTLGQWQTELCMKTHREMEGPLTGSERRHILNRHLEADRRCFLDRPVEDGRRCFIDRPVEDGRRCFIDRPVEDDWRRVSNRSLEEDRRHVLDRHQEDNWRHVSDRSLEDDIQYQTINADVYAQARRQQHTATRPMSDRSVPQVYHNPYAVQAGPSHSSTNRHVYHFSANRPQHSAFYTLAKSGSFHEVQEGACDTDLDSLPVPQWKGRCVRGQSLPPPALYHSLESVARPVPSRSGFTASSELRGTPYTSSVTPSHGGHLYPRHGSNSWNPNPSRYPNYQAGPSIDHRYYTQQLSHNPQWQPQASRGLSREQLHEDNQAHTSNRRQPQVSMRRCQSVDEGNRSTRPHLDRSRAGQQDGAGSFYQNNSALRAEMENGATVIAETLSVRQPVLESYPTPGGRGGPRLGQPTLLSKKVLSDDIAGCVGVVGSRDTDHFLETVI